MNEALVVKVAQQFSDALTPEALIKLFEGAKAYTGLYYYLGAIVNSSEHKEVCADQMRVCARMVCVSS